MDFCASLAHLEDYMIRTIQLIAIVFVCCLLAGAQTPAGAKNFAKDNLSFDYSDGWTLTDDSNSDAQQLTLSREDSDVQIKVFVHRGRVTPEKLPDAKKAFIDPYVAGMAKQFIAMGAKPEQSPDTSEIGGMKADGTNISASLGGESGAAKIYWALMNQRVVVLTLFGPDKETKQHTAAWDLLRTSIKVLDPKATATPKP